MFLALWEYEVKPGCQKRFLKLYGPEGDWAKLFRKDANYQQTQLLHDLNRPATYLTLDFWASRQAYEAFMETHVAEYKELDDAAEGLTLRERKIGWFERLTDGFGISERFSRNPRRSWDSEGDSLSKARGCE